jgi:3-oxoacyl-(acyl-carrier-protein) synthase III
MSVPPGGLGVRLLGTGRALAGDPVPTAAVLHRLDPDRDPARLVGRIGIDERRWIVPAAGEAPFPHGPGAVTRLATAALREALDAAGLAPTDLRRIILATSTGGDQLIPSTATNVARAFELSDSCDCFDVNNACTGFLNALDIACRSVATGLGPVAVIGAEVLSRYLHPDTPRSYLVLADAAAAVIVGPGPGQLLASHLRMRHDLSGDMRTPHPGVTGLPSAITFDAPLDELTESALRAIRDAGDAALAAAGLGWGDVDWFLPHQPNGELFDAIVARCGVDPARTVPVARAIGSTAAASVPYSLDVLVRSGRLRPGHRILLAAVGAGTGYGALLCRWDG